MADNVLFVGPLERVLYLRTLPALEGLPAPELAAIAQHARERFFPRGSRLFEPQQPVESLHLIVDGRVRVSRASGSEVEVGGGETVGLLDLLARSPSGVGARAVEDTQTLELDWDEHMDVCEEYFSITHSYLRYLARELLRAPPDPAIRHNARAIASGALNELNLVERAIALARCSLFSAGNADSLVELARHTTPERIPSRASAWGRGDSADYFLVIVSGTLRSSTGAREVELGPAETAGLYEALAESGRQHGVTAGEDTVTLRVDMGAFLDIVEDQVETAVDVMATLAGRLLAQGPAAT